MKNNKGGTYPPEIRSFAMTLQYYSSKAYEYVRNQFKNCLPHPETIRLWHQVIDGSPGFTKQSLELIKQKASEFKDKGKQLICALMVDEVAIRKHIEWDQYRNRFIGFIDCGSKSDDENMPVAKEAIVFMITSVNDNWKIPVGYFLINGLNAKERSNLVKECLHFLNSSGAEIVSLTFDGNASNIAMVKELGASMDFENLKPSFINPADNSKNIKVLLDICHMVKLIRNVFASKQLMYNSNNEPIRWSYIIELEKIQTEEGLVLANKLSPSHIQWFRQKMKVKLAVQTLSLSVAKALSFLEHDLKNKTFQGAGPTVEFITIINNCFDVFNSRNLLSKGFQKPLSKDNFFQMFETLNHAAGYIRGLKITVNGNSILSTKSHTGFLGFLIAIQNIQELFEELVMEKNYISFLMSYKFSQDHLEMFFCAVRSRNGHNDNPSARQFEAAYKRLLSHIDIKISKNANATEQEKIDILRAPSTKKSDPFPNINNINPHISKLNVELEKIMDDEMVNGFDDDDEDFFNDNEIVHQDISLNRYIENIVIYIAGFVKRSLKKKIKCEHCLIVLDDETYMDQMNTAFLVRKNRGGLEIGSKDLVEICRIAEKSFCFHKSNLFQKNSFEKIVLYSMRQVSTDTFKNMNDHIINQCPFDNHRTILIKSILFEYLKIRFHRTASITTQKLRENYKRNVNTKLIHFAGH